jgi:membrane protease YdiL (CAAX protease family)
VLQPTLTGLILGVAATVPLLVALVWMLRSSWSPVRRLVVLVTELVGALVAGRSLVALGALALLAGVSEEILFRGVIQQALTRWLPSELAMVAASALFGLVHFASRAYAVFAAIMGLYLGTLFVITGNLFAPIVAHAAYDFVALVWLARGHA